jgi:hypothetical protein
MLRRPDSEHAVELLDLDWPTQDLSIDPTRRVLCCPDRHRIVKNRIGQKVVEFVAIASNEPPTVHHQEHPSGALGTKRLLEQPLELRAFSKLRKSLRQ